jgi:hypothetical protein
MLEVAVSVVDRLIQLATVRERNKEKYFNNFVEPLYKDAEQVARDYMALFSELTHRLEKAENTGSVIDWLEERRTTFQPLRMKMRVDALLACEQIQSFLSAAMPEFQNYSFQPGVFLPIDAIEVCGFDTRFLQLLEEAARFDADVLPDFARVRIVIADQQHVILQAERVKEGVHLFRRSKARFIQDVEGIATFCPVLAACTDEVQLQRF